MTLCATVACCVDSCVSCIILLTLLCMALPITCLFSAQIAVVTLNGVDFPPSSARPANLILNLCIAAANCYRLMMKRDHTTKSLLAYNESVDK